MTDESVFAAALAIGSPADRARYLDRACAGKPDLRREVEELIAAHANSNPLDQPLADLARTGAYLSEGGGGEPTAAVGDRIGPYRLMEQIGEGGFGLVFVAEQSEPVRRKVALKVLKPGMDTREVVARFEAERQALALMDHPHIAKIFDGGTTPQGRPYFVMELVRGMPITDYCDQQKLPPRERLTLFVQVCQAVQHAHQKGIIHRDLKPSNVLVAPHDGLPVVKVIDFGVAKAVGQSLTEKTIYTRFAQMIGTPMYMSPEQAEVNQLDVDTRSDVYALGVMLYELLTGTTPFDRDRFRKAAFDEIRRIIREEEPPRPSTRLTSLGATLTSVSARRATDPGKLAGLVRGELDWIVMRCLEKDRNRRYDSANGLARDVQRYLKGDAVEACPPTLGYRLRKAYRRNRTAVLIATGFVVVLLVGTGLSLWQAKRATVAEGIAAEQRDEADARRSEAIAARIESDRERENVVHVNESLQQLTDRQRRTLYATSMNLAQAAWESGDAARTFDLLRRQPENLRGFEWHYWNRFARADRRTVSISGLRGVESYYFGPRLSPDGRRLAAFVITTDHSAASFKMWDTETGRELLDRPVPAGRGLSEFVNFSRDGRYLAESRILYNPTNPSENVDLQLKVWDTASGAQVYTLPEPKKQYIYYNALSADGGLLAYRISNSLGGTPMYELIVRRLPSGEEVFHKTFHDAQRGATLPVISPDGKHIAVVSRPEQVEPAGWVRVWEINSGREVWKAPLPNLTWYTNLVYSSDGARLAVRFGDRENNRVIVLNAATGAAEASFTPPGLPTSGRLTGGFLAFDPSGSRLAVTQRTQVFIYGIGPATKGTTAPILRVLRGHESTVVDVAFDPEGAGLTTLDGAGVVKHWRLDVPEPRLQMPLGYTILSPGVLPNPDCSRIAYLPDFGDQTPRFRLTDAPGRVLAEQPLPTAQGVASKYSRDGRTFVFGRWEKEPTSVGVLKYYLWDVTNGKEIRRFLPGEGSDFVVALNPDGSRVAVAVVEQASFYGVSPAHVTVWETATGREVFSHGGLHVMRFFHPVFSPDGRWLAVTVMADREDDSRLVWLDSRTGKEFASLTVAPGRLKNPEFSADGQFITATRVIGSSTTQPVWEVAPILRGEKPAPVITLTGHGAAIDRATFSPGGRRLLTSGGGIVKLWDAATGLEVLNLKSNGATLDAAYFSPDGNTIWGGLDETGRLWGWDATPLPEPAK